MMQVTTREQRVFLFNATRPLSNECCVESVVRDNVLSKQLYQDQPQNKQFVGFWLILDLPRTLDRRNMQPSRRYRQEISTIKALEKCTYFIMPAPALQEMAGHDPLISDMFRTHGNFGPTSRKKLPVLTGSSNTMGVNAIGRHEIKVVTAPSSTG